MTDPVRDDVTPQLLAPMVEQPEPSVDGDWYVLDLQQLLTSGYTHIELHFDSSDQDDQVRHPNAATLIKSEVVVYDLPLDVSGGGQLGTDGSER